MTKDKKLNVEYVPAIKSYFFYPTGSNKVEIISNTLTKVLLWIGTTDYNLVSIHTVTETKEVQNKVFELVAHKFVTDFEIPVEEAVSIVNHIRKQIHSTEAGKTGYNSVLEVLMKYQIPREFWWGFLYDSKTEVAEIVTEGGE